MSKEIRCQGCDPGAKPYHGCSHCGGYGVIMFESKCPTCDNPHWVRPGSFTMFDGKQFKTIDGVTITYRMNSLHTCSKCPVSERLDVKCQAV